MESHQEPAELAAEQPERKLQPLHELQDPMKANSTITKKTKPRNFNISDSPYILDIFIYCLQLY